MIFLRHPTPDVAPGTCYGQTDLDIAEVGHEQIEKAMATTPPVKRIMASPALRCRKLAVTLAERDNIEINFDERLWEMNMGEFEGKLWSEIECPGRRKFFGCSIPRIGSAGTCRHGNSHRVPCRRYPRDANGLGKQNVQGSFRRNATLCGTRSHPSAARSIKEQTPDTPPKTQNTHTKKP